MAPGQRNILLLLQEVYNAITLGRLSERGVKDHIVHKTIAGDEDIHDRLTQGSNEHLRYNVLRFKDHLCAIERGDTAHHEYIGLRTYWTQKRRDAHLKDIKRLVKGSMDSNFERRREGNDEVVFGHVSFVSVVIAARKEHHDHHDHGKQVHP